MASTPLTIQSPIQTAKGKIFNPGDEAAYGEHLATLDDTVRTGSLAHLTAAGAVTGQYTASKAAKKAKADDAPDTDPTA